MEVQLHKKDFKEIDHRKDHFQGQYKFNQPLIKKQREEFKWNNLKIIISLILELCKVDLLPVEAMCKLSFFITNSSDNLSNHEFRICDFFKQIFVMISFWTGKLRKKLFGPTRSLFSFSTAQTEKYSLKKVGKNCWNPLMNSLLWWQMHLTKIRCL